MRVNWFFLSVGLILIGWKSSNDVLAKKIDKAIQTTYTVKAFKLMPVDISNEINQRTPAELSESNLNQIVTNDSLVGFAYIGQANSLKSYYDYIVMFDNDLVIKKAKVLIYRETFGAQIGTQRWLKQFKGKTPSDTLEYETDVIAISGATISATSMTEAVNNVLKSVAILLEEAIL